MLLDRASLYGGSRQHQKQVLGLLCSSISKPCNDDKDLLKSLRYPTSVGNVPFRFEPPINKRQREGDSIRVFSKVPKRSYHIVPHLSHLRLIAQAGIVRHILDLPIERSEMAIQASRFDFVGCRQ